MDDEQWSIKSSDQFTAAIGTGCAVLGGLFVWITFHKVHLGTHYQGAYWLGVLLITLGATCLLLNEKTETVVLPKDRQLTVNTKGLFGQRTRVIPFRNVDTVYVLTTNSSRGPITYQLLIYLKDGKKQATGYWTIDQDTIFEMADRLSKQIGCSEKLPPRIYPISAKHLAIAALGSFAIYVLWYVVSFGKICPAMWAGTAPPVIMGFAFISLLGLLKYLDLE